MLFSFVKGSRFDFNKLFKEGVSYLTKEVNSHCSIVSKTRNREKVKITQMVEQILF